VNTVTAKRDLLDNCRNLEYREALVFENVYTGVCSQIRVLREHRELSQAEFGRKAKMAQERISILEDPNAETKPTLKTLLRVASAFDVGLDVRFVPFETILDRSVNTDSSALQVPSFEEELPELEKCIREEELLAKANSESFHSFNGLIGPPSDEVRRYMEAANRAMVERVMAYSAGGMLQGLAGSSRSAPGPAVAERETGLSADFHFLAELNTESQGVSGGTSVPPILAPVIPIDSDVKQRRHSRRTNRGGRGAAYYGRTRKQAIGI
jgi:transcriptional regulator with XRE-family HTH domain